MIQLHPVQQDSFVEIASAGSAPYRVYVDRGWNGNAASELREICVTSSFLLSQIGLEDHVVARMAPLLEGSLSGSLKGMLSLDAGEENKSYENLGEVYETLIDLGADRRSVLLAAGGGTVGDFVGFVAATLYRGVDFVQFPSTLLAAVDASVGGKTAVNIGHGKNMVGAFHQPRLVFFNLELLETLPEREWVCGLAEMIKHGALEGSGRVLDFLRESTSELRQPASPALRRAVLESIAVKAAVVESDVRERGLRAVLNLGHTTAHALESLTEYAHFSHGEAVARGLVTMVLLSRRLCGLSESEADAFLELMGSLGLPRGTAGFGGEDVAEHLKYDKKTEDGVPLFVLLEALGRPVTRQEVSRGDFLAAWEEQERRFGSDD